MPGPGYTCTGLLSVEVLAGPEAGSPKFHTRALTVEPTEAQRLLAAATLAGAVKLAVLQEMAMLLVYVKGLGSGKK